ncbi:MAG: tRNA-dihydrouridine synthase family protein [Thermodesulfobacteriota bacterium]
MVLPDKRDPPAAIEVRGVVISPPLALAPMVGLSHSALRRLIVEIGGIGLLFTEMLSVGRLPDESILSPFLVRSESERPLFYQIFAGPKQNVLPAVDRIHRLDGQGIDINLGCPAPNLRKIGAGCAMTRDLKATASLIRTVRQATELPLSAKIRLGAELDTKPLTALVQMLESEGVDLITVHGRLDGEKFCRKPRWHLIRVVKEAVGVPVLANGSVFDAADARRCLEDSCADGLMIGRGAVRKPWLFAEIASSLYGLDVPVTIEPEKIYLRFIELLKESFAPERRLGRLKQFTHYFGENFQFGHQLAMSVQRCDSVSSAEEAAAKFFLSVNSVVSPSLNRESDDTP